MKIYHIINFYLLYFIYNNTENIIFENLEFQNNNNNIKTLNLNYPLKKNENTGLNAYKKIIFNVNNIIFNVFFFMIGNDNVGTTIFLPSLPVYSLAEILPIRYMMTAIGNSNPLYIGNSNSPLPPPDINIIPDLLINNIYSNNNDDILINPITGSTIIGNSENNLIINANKVEISNTNEDIANTVRENYSTNIHFICPINIQSNLHINNDLNIINNLQYQSNDTVFIENIYLNNTTVNNTIKYGRNEGDSLITFNGSFSINSNNIIFGSINNMIKNIIHIPSLDTTSSNFYYLLIDSVTKEIFKGPAPGGAIIEEDIIYDKELYVNFINQSNSANTIFQANKINIRENDITFNGNFSFNNVSIFGYVLFDNIAIDQNKNIFLEVNTLFNINSRNLIIGYGYYNNLNIYGKVSIPLLQSNYNLNNFNYAVVKKDNGLICITPSVNQKSNDTKKFDNNINKYEKNIDQYQKSLIDWQELFENLKKVIQKKKLAVMRLRYQKIGIII